jgi:hypothetical protein
MPVEPAQADTSHISFCGFCTEVLDVTMSPAQRVLALVAFDRVEPCELEGRERELARRLFGGVDRFPPEARSVLVLVAGARSGKSYIFGGLYSLWRALTADLSTLAKGELAVAVIVAPDMRLARQELRFAHGAAMSVPEIASLVEAVTSDSFTIRRSDGHAVAIEVLPATRGGSALRGRSLVSCVLAECAYFRDANAVVNDVDCFEAAHPRVFGDGMSVMPSTPHIEGEGLLSTEFTKNWSDPSSAMAAHGPTLLMFDTPRNRAASKRDEERNPDRWRLEWLAEFMTGGASTLYGPELIGPMIDRRLLPCPTTPLSGLYRVAVAGDIGLSRDASAFVALHFNDREILVAEILELRPRKNVPLKLRDVVLQGCAFGLRHGVSAIVVDDFVLGPARDHTPEGFQLVRARGGQEAKVERHLRLREFLREPGRIRCPGQYVRLGVQLGSIISKPTSGGGMQISMPRKNGTHGDAAAAFVLGVEAAGGRRENPMVHALRMASRGSGSPRDRRLE